MGGVGAVVPEDPNGRLLLPSVSEGCRPFSGAGTSPLLGQLLSVPPTCLRFPALFSLSGAARGSRRRLAACVGTPRHRSRGSDGLREDLGVMAESLSCDSLTSFLEGESLLPPLPATFLCSFSSGLAHLLGNPSPLDSRSWGCHLVEDFRARALRGSCPPWPVNRVPCRGGLWLVTPKPL